MDEPDFVFPQLLRAVFLQRISRFSAKVKIEKEVLARLTNTGRLRDALVPGNEVLVRREPSGRFQLVAARLESGRLCCVDAQLAPQVLTAALLRKKVPSLAGFRVVRSEPKLGKSRADLLLEDHRGKQWFCECKSVTLVRRGAALFPDAPTDRGTRHVKALTRQGGVLAFVVLRGDTETLKINEPIDERFAAAVRQATGRVRVVSLLCDVTERGIFVQRELQLRWFDNNEKVEPLPDFLDENLRLLFVGMNPGLYSAWYGMYFANPRNRFWSLVKHLGIVSELVGPGDEAYLLKVFRIGFTDLVKRPTSQWAEVTEDEKRKGVKDLLAKIERFRPKRICFVGLGAARAVLGAQACPGPAPVTLLSSRVFVLPSTSPRQKCYSQAGLTDLARSFREWLKE